MRPLSLADLVPPSAHVPYLDEAEVFHLSHARAARACSTRMQHAHSTRAQRVQGAQLSKCRVQRAMPFGPFVWAL